MTYCSINIIFGFILALFKEGKPPAEIHKVHHAHPNHHASSSTSSAARPGAPGGAPLRLSPYRGHEIAEHDATATDS